jgi:ABC-type branched-subunit amino acid transport system substrate-binding protein
VAFLFNPLGTPTNTAIHRYMNQRKVPHLFLATSADKWGDYKNFPWTIGYAPSYRTEAQIYGKFIKAQRPNAKAALIYQNDDFGKDYLKGLQDGLGAKKSMIVMEDSYELSEPSIDTHIVKLKATGADVLVIFTTPKFGAQTIKKVGELGWKPMQIIANVSASTANVMKPAGLDFAQGIISATYAKDTTDPQWNDDPGMKDYKAFLAKYVPEVNVADSSAVTGYNMAQTMVAVLKQCGDDLTRANVMKQAASIKDLEQGGLLPGIKINTSATDFSPIEQLRLMRFKGERWELFGGVIDGEVGGSR